MDHINSFMMKAQQELAEACLMRGVKEEPQLRHWLLTVSLSRNEVHNDPYKRSLLFEFAKQQCQTTGVLILAEYVSYTNHKDLRYIPIYVRRMDMKDGKLTRCPSKDMSELGKNWVEVIGLDFHRAGFQHAWLQAGSPQITSEEQHRWFIEQGQLEAQKLGVWLRSITSLSDLSNDKQVRKNRQQPWNWLVVDDKNQTIDNILKVFGVSHDAWYTKINFQSEATCPLRESILIAKIKTRPKFNSTTREGKKTKTIDDLDSLADLYNPLELQLPSFDFDLTANQVAASDIENNMNRFMTLPADQKPSANIAQVMLEFKINHELPCDTNVDCSNPPLLGFAEDLADSCKSDFDLDFLTMAQEYGVGF